MPAEKETKRIFVIMPFSETPTRSKEDLSEFFTVNLKAHIEDDDSLAFQYRVSRSDDSFDITSKLISDLYTADLVLCDLSGESANPNVMYELGVRLAVSNGPVILFREDNENNRRIFDVDGFYIEPYRVQRYRLLEDYIIRKIKKFESGEEVYESPILRLLQITPSVVSKVIRDVAFRRLGAACISLRTATRRMGDALGRHLMDDIAGKDADEVAGFNLIQYLHEHRQELNDRDWGSFHFRLHSIPAIDAYLSDFPLAGQIDPPVEYLLNDWIAEFHSVFFVVDEPTMGSPVDMFLSFFMESGILSAALMETTKLMNTQSPDQATIHADKIADLYKQSAVIALRNKMDELNAEHTTGEQNEG